MAKVGLGLRIDDLPDAYRFREQAITWESQFWHRPVAPGLFDANIDTTFAIYRGRSEFVFGPSLRTGWPYVARHEPWYCDSDNPSEEQRFYDESPKVHPIHWSGEQQPDWLLTAVAALRASKNRLLHLGCGPNIMCGWTNLDAQNGPGIDLVFDLDTCAAMRLPFDDNSVDGFFMGRGLDAIENVFEMMQELYRVAKPGAKFIFRLPYGSHDDAAAASARRRAYVPDSFCCFAQPVFSRADHDYRGDWDLVRVRLVVRPELLHMDSPSAAFARIECEPNLVDEMIVEMRAIKPGRAREPGFSKSVTPVLSGETLDMETQF